MKHYLEKAFALGWTFVLRLSSDNCIAGNCVCGAGTDVFETNYIVQHTYIHTYIHTHTLAKKFTSNLVFWRKLYFFGTHNTVYLDNKILLYTMLGA